MFGHVNGLMGNSENPIASFGKLGPSGFGGATNNAPFTLRCVRTAQWATSRQARLCATNTVFAPNRATDTSKASTHSSQTGRSQSRCGTRTKAGLAASHRLCQWDGPELPNPGRISAVVFGAKDCCLIKQPPQICAPLLQLNPLPVRPKKLPG